MSRSVETRCNIVRNTWQVTDDDGVAAGVVVHLVVQSVHPLLPGAYPAIAEVVAAGDQLAATLSAMYQAGEDDLGSSVVSGQGEQP